MVQFNFFNHITFPYWLLKIQDLLPDEMLMEGQDGVEDITSMVRVIHRALEDHQRGLVARNNVMQESFEAVESCIGSKVSSAQFLPLWKTKNLPVWSQLVHQKAPLTNIDVAMSAILDPCYALSFC